MTDIATAALRLQVRALIDGWQRDRAGAQEKTRGLRGEEGRNLSSYYDGYADALDRCVQALKMLEDGL